MPEKPSGCPRVLPMRERADVIYRVLQKRLETILPAAMREQGLDMWLILCQEDDLDPVFQHLIPLDTWCPILQMLIFFDRGPGEGIEKINLSQTNMRDLFAKPWGGKLEGEQWELLVQIIEQRDPGTIGINTGSVEWAAGGLTHNLYTQLCERLPERYRERLVSAEPAATRFLSTLTDDEVLLYEHVVHVAGSVIADTYSRGAVVPGLTTTEDLTWHFYQRCADSGLQVSFKPSFYLFRSDSARELHGREDNVIRPGDCIRCDVGIHYLRLNSDHQRWLYILKPGEEQAPQGLRRLMAQAGRLQDVFMAEFRQGLSGNQLLSRTLDRARNAGIPQPKVYSHSLGLFLHEPGPLIGLPWEQARCEGRGDVALEHNYSFTMELSVTDLVPEWGDQEVRFALEEDVVFTSSGRSEGCRTIGPRQREFYLV